MAKTISLLLTENVENLGIVGDVVGVKPGYARNYLLPMGLATEPSDEMIASLQERRKEAEKQVAALRVQREDMVKRLEGYELTLERSCNDQGVLYAGVTQQDIATALNGAGFELRPRDVRLPHAIKRLDSYDLHIKLDQDLETDIKLWVVADRHIEEDEREEMEFDNEGSLIEPTRKPRPAEGEAETGAEGEAQPAGEQA